MGRLLKSVPVSVEALISLHIAGIGRVASHLHPMNDPHQPAHHRVLAEGMQTVPVKLNSFESLHRHAFHQWAVTAEQSGASLMFLLPAQSAPELSRSVHVRLLREIRARSRRLGRASGLPTASPFE